jgi:ERCC4-related helicase
VAGASRNPDGAQIRLLQFFLQAYVIMRSKDVLKLPLCKRLAFPVMLELTHSKVVADLTEKYRQAAGMDAEEQRVLNASGEVQEGSPLGLAVRAQMYTLHSLLVPKKKLVETNFTPNKEDFQNITAEELNKRRSKKDLAAGERRRKWLDELKKWTEDQLLDSLHLRALTSVIARLVKTEPARKIVVFSQYLRYLNIVFVAMKRLYGITCLRFNGKVP